MPTLTVQPDATAGFDTYIDMTNVSAVASDATIVNFGATTIGENFRSLVRLDLSAIPSTATIKTAVMTLITSCEFYPGPVIFYRVTQAAWTEVATATKYDATHDWLVVGGDYDLTINAVAAIPLGLIQTTTVRNKDFVAMVQDAITNRSGILNMIGIAEPGATGSFYSSDWAVATLRPKIVVDYTESIIIIDPPDDPPSEPATLIQSDPFPLAPTQAILQNRAF